MKKPSSWNWRAWSSVSVKRFMVFLPSRCIMHRCSSANVAEMPGVQAICYIKLMQLSISMILITFCSTVGRFQTLSGDTTPASLQGAAPGPTPGVLRVRAAAIVLGGARALGMSQPAVWQQVRALERDFGVGLLQPARPALGAVRGRPGAAGTGRVHRSAASTRSMTPSSSAAGVPAHAGRHRFAGSAHRGTGPAGADFCRQASTRPTDAAELYRGCGRLDAAGLRRGGPGRAAAGLRGGRAPAAPGVGAALRAAVGLAVTAESIRWPRKRRVGSADIVRYPLILPEGASNWRKRVEKLCRERPGSRCRSWWK